MLVLLMLRLPNNRTYTNVTMEKMTCKEIVVRERFDVVDMKNGSKRIHAMPQYEEKVKNVCRSRFN
jgi:hypothetical protein